ncbi:glutathione transferase GstA [Fertoebacter nigrum]|uniref:Glutathione transferase GstA n=1 Tax=Fertoeibacter niger TaxID=2656921 RepID=A0A8X8KK29_9RHOB|nr:glutathione transferase GstA [Fertoeibacter niger]NUB43834.1 glutathione transferase GstA [Fertoeibacter niger]
MKLYYSPGACSLASHIVLHEVGADFSIEKVDIRAKVTETGADYWAINPKGAVPALDTGDGVLTEGVAIMQYLADSHGATTLAPAPGTMARARVQEALNFVSAEVHKGYSPLFNPAITEEGRSAAMANLHRKLGILEATLADGRDYLTGADFTLPDAYAFVVTGWSGRLGVDLAAYPRLQAMTGRVAGRPAVQQAMQAEGLLG